MSAFWGYNNSWVSASDIKAMVSGTWKSSNVSLIGSNGKWKEIYSNETSALDIYIDYISERAGTPYQNIILSGFGFSQDAIPYPSNYSYYPLKTNLVDSFQGFSNLRLSSGTSVFNDGIVLSGGQYIKSPTDYDALGLIGTSNTKYIMFGMQYKFTSMNVTNKMYLFDTSSTSGRISVYVQNNNLTIDWKNDSVSATATIQNAYLSANNWAGFYVVRPNNSNTTTIVSDLGTSASFTSSVWYTPTISDIFSIGYGNDNGTQRYSNVVIKKAFFRNSVMDYNVANDVINPNLRIGLSLSAIETGNVTLHYNSIINSTDNFCSINVPNVQSGNYLLGIKNGSKLSNYKFFTVASPKVSNEILLIDSTNLSTELLNNKFILAHKKWGGDSGGVVKENVYIDGKNIRIRACGDLYSGNVRGVDSYGNRTSANKCIGGCLVTNDYFGPGSYRIDAKFPTSIGACAAMWTFHYEEAYPGTALYDQLLSDGLPVAGDIENGFYIVRNHEIDIETPTALSANPNQEDASYLNSRFNSWRGDTELNSTTNFINHNIQLNDGNFHEIGFDWYISPTPMINFYIDGVLTNTITTNIPDIPGRLWIGIWFPRGSVGNRWAGYPANYDEEYMDVRKISIIPFTNQEIRTIGETYLNDVFRRIK